MTMHSFILNGEPVSVECEDDVRVLWVLRDLLGVTGPKYGCGLAVCQACTSHLDGEAFQPCGIRVVDVEGAEITTIEGLAGTVEGDLHPVQQVWIDHDVAQCGYCQPGQIMTAVDLIRRVHAEGRTVTEADLDGLRNLCRCGTYPRVRAAIKAADELLRTDPPVAAVPKTAAGAASPATLPATGGATALGAATVAAGAAVAIRTTARTARD